MGSDIEPAVLAVVDDPWVGQRPPMHKNTVSFVAFSESAPAHFLCALLSSPIVNVLARSSSVKGGKSFGNTNLLETVAIPAFDSASPLHQRLAALSARAHELAAPTPGPSRVLRESGELTEVEREIDEAAAELWGLSAVELAEIRRSLEELW